MKNNRTAKAWRTMFVTALVLVLGASGWWLGTDGFTAYTAETARRVAVLRSPHAVPETVLQDQDGSRFTLADYRGKVLAIDFIYTRCVSLCRSLGIVFRQLDQKLAKQPQANSVRLLSISFDVEKDDPAALRRYARQHGADGKRWRVARVASRAGLNELLDAFGVIVIPDDLGGYEHNAALHLIDAQSRLVWIGDLDRLDTLQQEIRHQLQRDRLAHR